jgi:hypothetical protein
LSPSYFGPRPLLQFVASSIGSSPVKPSRRIRPCSWLGTRFPRLSGWRGTLLLALVCCLELVPSASAQTTLLNESVTPSLVDSNDGNAVELGVKFRSDTSGFITALRFYKATTNTGTHVGHIWSSSGALLASATFTGETGSGWQQVNFSTPIAVSANTTYIASYFAPSGHYSANVNAFATTGIDNPPLHALANGVSGSNGVYLYSSTGGFPTNSYQATNYWVDIVYTAAQSTSPATTGYTIMKASATPTLVDSNDPAPVEVGVKFRADSNGYVTGLRFYKASTNVGTHVGHIWSGAGLLLGSATFTSETGSGWQQVNFSTPIAVSASTTYIASYFAPSGHYSQDENYFATTGIDNPPLHALANGADGSDGVYLYSSTPGFPANTYKSTNYWVDIVYTAAQSGTTNPQLTVGPTTLSFGSVALNTATTQSLTLTSSGTSPVTVNSASTTGSSFAIVTGTLPATLNPGQSTTLQVQFKPTATGSATGNLTISSNSTTGSAAVVSLSGTGATAASPKLTLSATTLSFGSVTMNSSTTQALTLTSSGTSAATVNSASITGAAFSIVGATMPATLNPGQSMTLQVQFKPTATGSATGNLTIGSNSTTGTTAVVSLSGTGTTVNSQLTLGATTLSFGSVAVNTATTQSLTLTSSGTSSVTVNAASITGAGFTLVGGSFPVTLNPNQSTTLQVQFKPTAAGSVTGSLTITSNSTNGSTAVVSLSGTGTATPHEVDLSWTAPGSSADPVAGYNVYRSTGAGANQLLNASVLTATTYVDSTVVSGTAYTYSVKSVDSSGVESAASNQTTVTVP